jgi:molecular chaperone DnaK
MNSAFDRLQTASHKLAEVLYNQAGATPTGESTEEQASSASASGDSTSSSADDNVIDAEYVDVEDDEKK